MTFSARFRLLAAVRTLKRFIGVLGLLLLAAVAFAVRFENAGLAPTTPSAGYFPASKLHVDAQPAASPTSAVDDADDETKALPPALQTPDRASWLLAGAPKIPNLPAPVLRAPDRRLATLVGVVLIVV